jgi:DMSO/TMAO reductase YedYZ heme-binding membrane subunit
LQLQNKLEEIAPINYDSIKNSWKTTRPVFLHSIATEYMSLTISTITLTLLTVLCSTSNMLFWKTVYEKWTTARRLCYLVQSWLQEH